MEQKLASVKPIGRLEHKPTLSCIPVYYKIGWFRRLMLNWCLGLKYQEYKSVSYEKMVKKIVLPT